MITVTIKSTYVMGDIDNRVHIIFNTVVFIINTLYLPLCEILTAFRIKLFAAVLQLCVSLLLSAKLHPQSVSFRSPKRWKAEGAKSGL